MLTREYIEPFTRQCAAIGAPATTSVPAATAVDDAMLVFGNESRVTRSVHELRVAPVAAGNCGKVASSSLPPQAVTWNIAIAVSAAGQLFFRIPISLLLQGGSVRGPGPRLVGEGPHHVVKSNNNNSKAPSDFP